MSDASVSREECEAILKHVAKASATISDLCHKRKRWVMSIPARRDEDPDLILGDAVQNCQRLARAHLELLDSNMKAIEELRIIKADLLEIKVRVEELRRKSQWQPIEIAPKDGDGIILIWTGSRVLPIGIYLLTLATDESTPEHLRLKPTHWMPLPDPPEAK